MFVYVYSVCLSEVSQTNAIHYKFFLLNFVLYDRYVYAIVAKYLLKLQVIVMYIRLHIVNTCNVHSIAASYSYVTKSSDYLKNLYIYTHIHS